MAAVKVRNISGTDLDVPKPDGTWETVPANHQAEFEEAHARKLLEQRDVWEKVAPPKKDDKE